MKLEELTGEEKLARSIMTDDYKELLSQGSTVKLEYIPKLKDIGITEVYVQDKIADPEALAILKEDVNKNCKEKPCLISRFFSYCNATYRWRTCCLLLLLCTR